jgi:excisionase family DNA binding protein
MSAVAADGVAADLTTAQVMAHGRDLSVPQVAAILGVSDRTVRRIMDRGELPYHVPSRHPRIRLVDLEAYRRGKSSDRRVVLTVPPGGDPFAD